MMRALVTGAAGFVGRHLTAELRARGYGVDWCDIAAARDAFDLFGWPWGIEPYDLVVHAAARSPHRAAIDGDPGMHPYNVMLDAAMFDWAIRTRQRHVLYLSSCAALDGPVDDYAATKLTGERLAGNARAAGVRVTVVRPYSGYGEDQSENFPFRAIVERARRGDDPFEIWGDGSQVRDWIHISDVVAGALAVAESGAEEPVSLCTGIGTSMRELAELACQQVGYRPQFKLRADKPAGVPYRVGDPSVLHRYYIPQVPLEQGVKRALGGELWP
jgi:nucleoside-diphosphate-sugar epimerase